MKQTLSYKGYIILLLLLLCSRIGFSQLTAATYSFTATTGTFSSIAATGSWLGTSFWANDFTFTGVPIGFNFTYCGTSYNQGSINTNGWFSLSNTTPPSAAISRTNSTANVANNGPALLMPYWDNLTAVVSGDGYFQTSGTAPNRVFTVEWNVFGTAVGSGVATFQIKLYETTNVIEYLYGSSTYSGNSATIGIANSSSDFQTLPGTGASPVPSSATFTTSISGSPANGQIYRWSNCGVTATASASPAVCPGGTITLTGTTVGGTTYSWAGPGGFSSASLSPVTSALTTSGVYSLTVSTGTCSVIATTYVTLLYGAGVPVVTPASATICNGGNVTLTAAIPSTPVPILSQNFNGALSPWTIDNTGLTSTSLLAPWQQRPNGYSYSGTLTYNFNSPDASQFMLTVSDQVASTTLVTSTKLVSPVFSLVGYTGINLSFQHAYQGAAGETASVDISTDGGATWTTINNYGTAGTSVGLSANFATASFSLAAYAGQPNCKLRFNYVASWSWWWAIDNVMITGIPTTPVPPVWTPVTDLFSNPGLTTPYVTATPATTVYVHPTTISSPTVVNYIATTSNGICTAADTAVVTINPGVPAITGTTTFCAGTTTSLFNTSLGGAWSSSNITVATVNAVTGVVTGLTSGTDTIFYTVTGCSNFTVVTVNTGLSTPITGPGNVCLTGSITLNNTTAGGTWTTAAPGIASINSVSGLVTGLGIGTTIITYTAPITGCYDTAQIAVIGLPNPITGSMVVCFGGGTTTLSETTGGGVWSSGTPLVATVDAGGVVYGVSGGVAVISYSMPSGCYVTANVTVNPPLPSITGPAAVCAGSTISLGNTATGGTWTSGTTAAATVTGAGTSATVGGVALGSSAITYSVSVGCSVATTITVNPLPSSIAGPSGVCAGGATILLTDASGTGTWSSSGPAATATIASGGVVTGGATGNVTITYTLPVTGCYVTAPITVNPLPAAITGASAVCENGATVSVSDVTGTGTWSGGPGTALTIDAAGTITGVAAGAGSVTYTLPVTGCYVTRAITVNPVPAAIGGTPVVCLNQSALLTDASTPGTWSSSNANVTMGSPAGTMTGAAVGTANITYTLNTTGCYVSVPATVNSLPAPIGGTTTTVCGGGATITLTETTGGGTWSSGATGTATVDAGGVVYGVAAGSVPITYTITATGCYISTNVTVLPIPAAITGTAAVCEAGSVTTLADATTPGTWSISPAGFASITSAGVVTGIAAGSATVTYTGSNSCFNTTTLTVNPLPATITGALSVCQTSVTTLSSTPGGTWVVGNPFVATVSAGGGVTGLIPGTSTITYTLPTGCRTTTSVTVNSIPAAISGSPAICINGISTLSNAIGGGTWSSSDNSIASINASTGVAYGAAIGAATITYTTGTSGCYVTLPVNVTSIVVPSVTLSANPSTTVCAGDPVSYSASITNGGSSPLYVWSVNNMILSGASTYNYVPADGDVVRLWILSSYGCAVPDTASNWVTMTVHPIVTPSVSLSLAGGDTVCTGAFTTINAVPVAGGSAPTYQWYVNLGFVGTSSTYGYVPANGDVVTAVLTSNAFCRTATTAAATKTLTVSPFITPFVSINASLGQTTCEGYPEVFTTNMTGGGTAPTYQWAVNGVNTVLGPVFSYPPANGDNVQVTMTSNFPCLTTPIATANETITVLPVTQPVGSITAQPGYIIPAGMYDTFTVTIISGGGAAPTYQWYIDNIPMAGATNSVFITNTLGNGDSVSCAVVNTDQCSGVTVFTSLHIAIGNNVGVHELNQNGVNLSLLPNPNNGSFTIKGDLGVKANEDVMLNITDVLGRKVYSNTAKTINGELNTQIMLNGTLANGQYILSVQSEHVSKIFHFVLEQ